MSDHDHHHGHVAENPHAGQGSVLLDIGGDVGAVILHLPAAWEGAEVEYRRHGEPDAHHHDHGHEHGHHHGHEQGHRHRPHVAVVGRPAGDRIAYSAVFPELLPGSSFGSCATRACSVAVEN